ncbi:MAG: MarC family protein [Gammaproteobacteria bacterium]|nr:MarC family protein [Gammaproteobacteria bacterium]
MDSFLKSSLLIFVLLNPFIMSIYLIQLIRVVDFKTFSVLLIRAGLISYAVFLLFAWAGELIFDDVMQIRFLAFMIFGGITFLVIGVRLILGVGPPVESINPQSKEIAGAIAMPFIVGPGTISASVLAGSQLNPVKASFSIGLGLVCAIASIILLKKLHDWVQTRHERYVERYVEIAGRVTALFTGSFAVDMILKGIERWRLLL